MTTTPLVELRNISRRFVAVQALQDINLTINQGDIHALVGENGAGKSTLGKIISGVESADEGELLVRGEPRSYSHPQDALRDGITTITQEISLLNNQSALHNVLLGQEICRAGVLQRRKMLAEFERLVELTGFQLDPDEKVGRLHMADQRKVEVMQAIARDARLIIMDEPTAMLADDETRVFLDIVRSLQRSGHTIVYISHFLEEVLVLADVVTVMRNGLHRAYGAHGGGDDPVRWSRPCWVAACWRCIRRGCHANRTPRSSSRCAGWQAPGLGSVSTCSCAPAKSRAWPAWSAAAAVVWRAPCSGRLKGGGGRDFSSAASPCSCARRPMRSAPAFFCCRRAARNRGCC